MKRPLALDGALNVPASASPFEHADFDRSTGVWRKKDGEMLAAGAGGPGTQLTKTSGEGTDQPTEGIHARTMITETKEGVDQSEVASSDDSD